MNYSCTPQIWKQLVKLEFSRKNKYKKFLISSISSIVFIFAAAGITPMIMMDYGDELQTTIFWGSIILGFLGLIAGMRAIIYFFDISHLNYNYQFILVEAFGKQFKKNGLQFKIEKHISRQDIVCSHLFSFKPNILENVGTMQRQLSHGCLRAGWVNATFSKAIYIWGGPVIDIVITIFRGFWISIDSGYSCRKQSQYWIIPRKPGWNWHTWAVRFRFAVLKRRITLPKVGYKEFNDKFCIYSDGKQTSNSIVIINSWKNKLLEIHKISSCPIYLALVKNKVIFAIQGSYSIYPELFGFKPYTSLKRINHNFQHVLQNLEILKILQQ